jgi:hypothetical protein
MKNAKQTLFSVNVTLEDIVTLYHCYNDVNITTDKPNALPVEKKEHKQSLLLRLIHDSANQAQEKLKSL